MRLLVRRTPEMAWLAIGLLAVCAGLAGCSRKGRLGSTARGPVILISVDTLRADHLPVYGYAAGATPNIDALAKDSIVFDSAYAQVPLTLPSHTSLLTGLTPHASGVRNNLGYKFDSASHPSLPTLLRPLGYESGAAVSAYVLRSGTGLAAAFDSYDDQLDKASGGPVGELQRAGDHTVAAALRWIEARKERPKFFYFLHLFEPHAPYEPPEPFRTKFKSNPYDGEIAASDLFVGRFLDELKRSGLYDEATIVFFSDHGEGLGDHGEDQHGIFLYREAIHVPLFVKLPDNEKAGSRVKTPVQLLDIVPTIAAIAGFDPPSNAEGTSLLEIAEKAPAERRIVSETMYPRIHLGWSDLASVVDERFHYIDAPQPELYDMVADPGETSSVLADQRRVYASLKKEVEGRDRSLAAQATIDPEEAAKLAALGYLGSTSTSSDITKLRDPKDGIADLKLLGEAMELSERGESNRAIVIIRDVLGRNPTLADGWTILAKAFERAGRIEEALETYKKTIEVAPQLAPGVLLSISELYLEANRFDESMKHAELALATYPAAARIVLARAHLGKRDFASAEREAQIVASDPSRARDGMVILAQVRVGQRRLADALAITDSLVVDGKEAPPSLWFVRGDALARLGRVPEGEQAFANEIELYPRNREAYVRLAVLRALQGREAEANQLFELMVAANPNPQACAVAAETLKSLGDSHGAEVWRKCAAAMK